MWIQTWRDLNLRSSVPKTDVLSNYTTGLIIMSSKIRAASRARTYGLRITNPLHCHLCYGGAKKEMTSYNHSTNHLFLCIGINGRRCISHLSNCVVVIIINMCLLIYIVFVILLCQYQCFCILDILMVFFLSSILL